MPSCLLWLTQNVSTSSQLLLNLDHFFELAKSYALPYRIVSNSEEIAFNDPPGGDTERLILNDHLNRYMRHSRLSSFQKFVQQVIFCKLEH